MSYEKQNFVDGQTLTAAQLKHMEDGIAKAVENTNFGSGLSETSKTLLLSLLENAAYTSPSMQAQLNALRTEWSSSGGGSGGGGSSGGGSSGGGSGGGGSSGGGSGGGDEIPVQSIRLSSSTLTLNEGESKTLTATVLPVDATNSEVSWSVSPIGIASVQNGRVTAKKAGSCTVTATAGGKWAQCAVTVVAAETAQLIYSLPAEASASAAESKCVDTGLKLLEHASTETPIYTILFEAKVADNAEVSIWPTLVNCQTETGNFNSMPGFNGSVNQTTGAIEFAYYRFSNSDARLCDTLAHAKMKTRYAIQMNGNQYRVGSTHCALSEWKTTGDPVVDVPETLIFGAAYTATGTHTRFLDCTIYQCKVYKGLLSDSKVQKFIEEA